MVAKKIRELCLKRVLGSVVWNIISQVIFINIFLVFINVEVFHPVRWIRHWTSDIFSLSTWLYIIPLSSAIVAQGIVCSRDYISLQPYYATRFSLLMQTFSVHSLLVALLYVFVGFLIPWIYLSLAGDSTYGRFVYKCTNKNGEDANCFCEDRMYVILACVNVNVYYFLDNHFLGSRHLTFPIIQLPKIIQIKSQFLRTIRESLSYVIIPNILFIILYYCQGGVLREFICKTFSLSYEFTPLDSVAEMCSHKLMFYLFVLTSITIVSMKIMEMLFKVFLTERCEFPICQPSLKEDSEILLSDALKYEDLPIVQHLAFLDLAMLAENSPHRRVDIFKLSLPGGHPRAWIALKNDCLKTIEDFVNDLSVLLVAPKCPKNEEKTVVKEKLPHAVPCVQKPTPNQFIKKRKGYEPRRDQNFLYEMLTETAVEWVTAKFSMLQNLPIVFYLFGDLQEMKIRFVLRRRLIVMWASESLSHLACYSLTEDNYGIVLNELHQIITTLLRLKEALDLLHKHFVNSTKSPKELSNYQKGVALRNSVNRCLYRIVNSFKPYITDLQLSKDSESKMLAFVAYKA